MLGAAVVPERDRMGLPAEPHLEFLPRAELTEKVQDRSALLFRQPVDMGGEFPLTYSALRFVTGWVRTIGCDAFG